MVADRAMARATAIGQIGLTEIVRPASGETRPAVIGTTPDSTTKSVASSLIAMTPEMAASTVADHVARGSVMSFGVIVCGIVMRIRSGAIALGEMPFAFTRTGNREIG